LGRFASLTDKNNNARLYWMLGIALTLPMILASGPIAGYFIGYLLIHQFHLPEFSLPLAMVLGLLGSGWQSYKLIQKLNQTLK
jgi:hypothetical protein